MNKKEQNPIFSHKIFFNTINNGIDNIVEYMILKLLKLKILLNQKE